MDPFFALVQALAGAAHLATPSGGTPACASTSAAAPSQPSPVTRVSTCTPWSSETPRAPTSQRSSVRHGNFLRGCSPTTNSPTPYAAVPASASTSTRLEISWRRRGLPGSGRYDYDRYPRKRVPPMPPDLNRRSRSPVHQLTHGRTYTDVAATRPSAGRHDHAVAATPRHPDARLRPSRTRGQCAARLRQLATIRWCGSDVRRDERGNKWLLPGSEPERETRG